MRGKRARFKTKEPKKVAVAPKVINTIEKPIVNKIIGKRSTFFLFKSSFNELPDIYDMYPGIRGKTQGDKKLINPAPKATKNSNITVHQNI